MIFANCLFSDEMQHNMAFHQDQNCLPWTIIFKTNKKILFKFLAGNILQMKKNQCFKNYIIVCQERLLLEVHVLTIV